MCDVSGGFFAIPSEFLRGVLFLSFQLGADSRLENAIFAENRSCWANWHRFCQCVLTGQLIRELQFVFGELVGHQRRYSFWQYVHKKLRIIESSGRSLIYGRVLFVQWGVRLQFIQQRLSRSEGDHCYWIDSALPPVWQEHRQSFRNSCSKRWLRAIHRV